MMGMSKKCYSFLRCLLVFLNIVLFLIGLSGVAVGAAGLWGWRGAEEGGPGSETGGAEEQRATAAALAGVAAWGGVLAGGAVTGAAGAARGAGAALAASFAALALCAAAEAGAAWWAAAHVPSLERALRARLQHTMRVHYGVLPSATQLVDIIHEELDCCGTEGPRDWQNSAWSRMNTATVSPDVPSPPSPVPAPPAPPAALDLTVSAPPSYYALPASCCPETPAATSCRMQGGSRTPPPSVRDAACGPRVLPALAAAARGPLAAAAAAAAVHVLALLLTLVLCTRARPALYRYKS